MQLQDPIKLKGTMTAVLTRPDGSAEVRYKDNIVVNAGFDFIADSIGNAAARPACMSEIAVGTSTTAPAATDTALGAELARAAATYAHTAGTHSFSFSVTFAAGVATGAITEAGILNAATAGTLFDHVVFAVINKASTDTLQITFTFSMS